MKKNIASIANDTMNATSEAPRNVFDEKNAGKRMDGWFGNSLTRAIAEKDSMLIAKKDDAWGYCDGDTPKVVVPFRMLASVAAAAAGSAEQISRIVSHLGHAHDSVDDLEPRLSRALAWTAEFVPESDRTTVRTEPDTARLATLTDREREWLALLLDGLGDGELDLGPVTALVYGVPKLARGLPLDDAPTDEVKADQKEFFGLLYRLLVDADRGPRLPTLIVALGADRVRSLLGA